jgi:hypothetical protein
VSRQSGTIIDEVYIVKRHAHIYKDPQASQTAFKNFNAGFDYQRSDSGMWYASHNDTHKFFAVTRLEKLRGIDWDTIEIAKDISPEDQAAILCSCKCTNAKPCKS